MADLSNHQSKIVKRYYDNQDNILSTRLSELVSELWLAEDKKKQTTLWGKAQVALMKLGVDATKVGKVVKDRDMESLAKLAQQASAGTLGPAGKGSRGPPRARCRATSTRGRRRSTEGRSRPARRGPCRMAARWGRCGPMRRRRAATTRWKKTT